MNVTIISTFRDAVGHIDSYCDQMDALQLALAKRGDTLTLLLGYGDSTDDTAAMLHEECQNRFDAILLDVSHGGPKFGSVVHPQRFKQLAYVGNKLLSCVSPDAAIVGIVESDLAWDAPTILALIAHLQHCEAIAPMVMDGERSFYDIFAFRKNGVHFTKSPPYCEWLGREVMKLDSAGSVLFMRGDLARLCRLTDKEVIVGLCKDIYTYGGSVWLDPTLTVTHGA